MQRRNLLPCDIEGGSRSLAQRVNASMDCRIHRAATEASLQKPQEDRRSGVIVEINDGLVIGAHSGNNSFYAGRRNMAIGRVICGEILDRLPADDPSALRSRLDLLAINALMGNIRWVRRALRRAMKDSRETSAPGGDAIRFVEIGAGDGRSCRKVARLVSRAIVTG